MIENSLTPLAYPPAIHMPKPAKVAAADIRAFVRADQAMEFNDLIDLASVPSGSADAIGQARPSSHLRLQWEAMCKTVHEKFADDFNPDPTSADFALEQKKADLRDAAGALKPAGLIGQYFARWCNNVDRGTHMSQEGATRILQAFNRFFGACLSCDVARQRIDAMLSAFSLDKDELFRADGVNELCSNGMVERLESIMQRKLKPSSNLVVSSTFYSTVDRFAARNGINVGYFGVHNVRNLSNMRTTYLSGEKKLLLNEAAKALGHEIEELLRETIPIMLADLHTAFSKTEAPSAEELDALEDKHLFAWKAFFPAGISGAVLSRNRTYLVWNDMGTAVTAVKWNDLIADFVERMMPYMGAEAILSVFDNNEWATPLKEAFESDPNRFPKLATSAESFLYIAKNFPDHVADLYRHRDPDTGQTCLHKLAAKQDLAPLIRKGKVNLHQLLENKAQDKTPFDILLENGDREAIEALYLRCLYHTESLDLENKVLNAIQRHLLARPVREHIPDGRALMAKYSFIVESEDSIAFYRGLGDPEKAALLAALAHHKDFSHVEIGKRRFDQMTIGQLETLVRIFDRTQRLPDMLATHTRVSRFLFDTIPPATLLEFTPRQLEEAADIARLGQDALDTINAHFDDWKKLSAEGMAAFRDLLQFDRASEIDETFLLRHIGEFFKLGSLEQVETASMFAGHRQFIERHATEWFRLDHTQMRLTRRALEAGLLGKLGTIRIDPRWKLANPLINPQKKWFKLSGAQMASMVADYGKDSGVDKQTVKRFPMLRKLDDLQIRRTVESFKKAGSPSGSSS